MRRKQGWIRSGKEADLAAAIAAAAATKSKPLSQMQSHDMSPCRPVPAISLSQVQVDPSAVWRLTPGKGSFAPLPRGDVQDCSQDAV